MEYKKYDMGAYNLHVIKTSKFKTVDISVVFKRKLKKEEITLRNFLSDILMTSSKKYPTSRALEIESENLYNMHMYADTSISGKYGLICINSAFLNEKYTEEGMNEESINFLMDLIFNPNVENNLFDKNSFDITYNALKEEIESLEENPNTYSIYRCLEEMDKDLSASFKRCGYLEDLNKITPSNLYEYYKSVIKSDYVDIFIVGDVDKEKIKELISSKFSVNTKKKQGESHYIDYDKFRKRAKIVKEQKDLNQSKLVMALKVSNLDDYKRKYALRIYSHILGGAPDSKLFQSVREKNSLCYYITCTSEMVFNLVTISSGINKENYKKCVNLIKKEIKNMQKGNIKDEDIEKAKIAYSVSYKELLDKPYAIMKNALGHEHLGIDLIEDAIENIKKIDKQAIIDVANSVHLDTIYLLEGGENHENA